MLAKAATLAVISGWLSGQRRRVLRQIKVPHSYYCREMYQGGGTLARIRRARQAFARRAEE